MLTVDRLHIREAPMPLRFLPHVLSTTFTIVIGSLSMFAQQLSVTRLDASKISPSRIDTAVARLMEAAHVTGVGIAILNDDKVVYLKTYGIRDKERHLPMTPDSVMTAASLTKPAFTAMVMQLVHERTVELDKPVYEYLPKLLTEYPAYKDLADDQRYKQITMRMLLDHTSGFPNWRRFTDDQKLKIYFPPDQDSPIPVRESLCADACRDRHQEDRHRADE
jgi:CubicO group peptidase (beta-lactamase class C family)